MVGDKIYRVRTTRAFAVGELVLVPFSLQDNESSFVNKSAVETVRKFEKPDLSQMDKDAINRCYVKVCSKEKKQRGKDSQEPNAVAEVFWAHSPLFWKRASQQRGINVAQDMSPLWAVPRSNANRDVNMEFEKNIGFDVCPIAALGRKMPNATKGAMWSVSVQCLTNIQKIPFGALLAVSVMSVEDEDEVA